MPAMEACAACGATRFGTAAWCGQCYAPVGADTSAPPTPSARWEPPARFTEPLPPKAYSRIAASTTTMGPMGRIGISLLCLLPLWWAFYLGLLGIQFGLLWAVVVCPLVLHSTWRKDRIG